MCEASDAASQGSEDQGSVRDGPERLDGALGRLTQPQECLVVPPKGLVGIEKLLAASGVAGW